METIDINWQYVLMTLVGALFSVVAYFLIDFKSRIHKVVDGFATSMKTQQDEHSLEMKHTRAHIDAHKTAMGMATKAINGDMLAIRQSVAGLKEQVSTELICMKDEVASIQREAKKLVNDLQMSSDRFSEKFEKIVQIQDTVQLNNGKIILLEETFASTTSKVQVLGQANENTKEILKKYREDLNKVIINQAKLRKRHPGGSIE